MHVNINNTFFMKSNCFSKQKRLVRRVVVFYILQISLKCLALIEDSWVLLSASAFNLLSYHMLHSFWKTSPYAPERMRVEKRQIMS